MNNTIKHTNTHTNTLNRNRHTNQHGNKHNNDSTHATLEYKKGIQIKLNIQIQRKIETYTYN